MPKDIRQTVTLPASPAEVYEALMDSRKHAAFTGQAAEISGEVGGSISAGDGYISGTNLELVPGRRIVQAWHASDWPEGIISTATFDLAADGQRTRLTFRHSGVPDGAYEDIRTGWHEFYWKPLKAWLVSHRERQAD